jgi:hypothetical protein
MVVECTLLAMDILLIVVVIILGVAILCELHVISQPKPGLTSQVKSCNNHQNHSFRTFGKPLDVGGRVVQGAFCETCGTTVRLEVEL